MEKIAVFVNEADYARHMLQPLAQSQDPVHWVVVACAPTLTRHIGRWVSQSAREQWRDRWATELRTQLDPILSAGTGNRVEHLLAKRSLVDLCARLESRLPGIRILDARRPRIGKPEEPLTQAQPPSDTNRWAYPVAVTTGLSAMLALAD